MGPIPAQVRYGSVGVRGSVGSVCGSGAGSVGWVRGVCADSWGPWVRLAVVGPGRKESPTPPALKGVQYVVAACCCYKSLVVVDMRILVCKDICQCNGNRRIYTHIHTTHTQSHTHYLYIYHIYSYIYILWVYLVVHAVTAVAGGVYIGCIYRKIYMQFNYFRRDPHPDTLFWHSFWHTIWKYIWHSIWASGAGDMVFGSRCAPQHPELAVVAASTARQKEEEETRTRRIRAIMALYVGNPQLS